MSAAMGSPQQAAQRPRSNTHFTFRSDKSNELSPTKSKPSKHDRKVSDGDRKPHYDLTTKANPNAAMNEAQPSTLSHLPLGCAPMFFANTLQLLLHLRRRRCSLSAHSHTPMHKAIPLVSLTSFCSSLPKSNGPQSIPISPTPHARDGSARSTPSSPSKPPLMASTAAGRSRCAPTKPMS
jgi:hypothetical protein